MTKGCAIWFITSANFSSSFGFLQETRSCAPHDRHDPCICATAAAQVGLNAWNRPFPEVILAPPPSARRSGFTGHQQANTIILERPRPVPAPHNCRQGIDIISKTRFTRLRQRLHCPRHSPFSRSRISEIANPKAPRICENVTSRISLRSDCQGLLVLNVAQAWLREMIKLRSRGSLTRDLLAKWLKPVAPARLARAGEIGVNPDQGIHEDARRLSKCSARLAPWRGTTEA